jgi:uracil-DNA glycosylase
MAQPPSRPRNVTELREAAAGCRACDLWENATQTVSEGALYMHG